MTLLSYYGVHDQSLPEKKARRRQQRKSSDVSNRDKSSTTEQFSS